ncbi:MAG TPA: hypothetical protein VLJ58_01850 [Ramlibacter sp.]|nr:hypothetical protein [Ramlibacter sp.]
MATTASRKGKTAAPATVRKPAKKTASTAAPLATAPGKKITTSLPMQPLKPIAAKAAKKPKAAEKNDKGDKTDKPKKPKLVRDSFTIPKAEYAVLEDLKQRATRGGASAKKSELLRAGIKALASMDEPAFLAAVGAVPTIKTGRPAKQ